MEAEAADRIDFDCPNDDGASAVGLEVSVQPFVAASRTLPISVLACVVIRRNPGRPGAIPIPRDEAVWSAQPPWTLHVECVLAGLALSVPIRMGTLLPQLECEQTDRPSISPERLPNQAAKRRLDPLTTHSRVARDRIWRMASSIGTP